MIRIKNKIPEDFQFGIELEFGFTKMPDATKLKKFYKNHYETVYDACRETDLELDDVIIDGYNGPIAAEIALRSFLKVKNVKILDEDCSTREDRKKHWCLGYDGSVHVGHSITGLELRSPPLKGNKGVRQLKKVLSILKDFCNVLDCRIGTNNSCGLHVHVDISKIPFKSIKSMIYFYNLFEDVFDSIHAPSRKNNHFATSYTTTHDYSGKRRSKDDVLKIISSSKNLKTLKNCFPNKYHKINIHSYYSTLEFRQHAGTLNANSISNWLTVIASMYKLSKKLSVYKENTKIKSLNNALVKQLKKEKLKTEQLRTILTQEI